MLENVRDVWKKHGFEILIGVSVFIIILIAIYRYGKKGTYSRSYYYKPIPGKRRRGPPKISTGENMCRVVLENIFKRPFKKARPMFLQNPVTGGNHNLEIDCFNEDLKLGVEYSGVQHYKFTPFFHRNKDAFMTQKYRDQMKKDLCVKNGICLIIVPFTIAPDDIRSHLIQELKIHGYLT